MNGPRKVGSAPPGGSATPGGTAGQLQYNNGGSFDGLPGTDVNATDQTLSIALETEAAAIELSSRFFDDPNLRAGGLSVLPGQVQVFTNVTGEGTTVLTLMDAAIEIAATLLPPNQDTSGVINILPSEVALVARSSAGGVASLNVGPDVFTLTGQNAAAENTFSIDIDDTHLSVGMVNAGISVAIAVGDGGSVPPSISISGLGTYADNAAAVAAGLPANALYKTATGELRIVV